MKQIRGIVKNIDHQIIGRITHNNSLFKKDKILICNEIPKILYGINALIMPKMPLEQIKTPIFVANGEGLHNGDIVNITMDGHCNVLWDIKSEHNALYITDACNSNCIMCPQPCPENPQNYFDDNCRIIDLINFKNIKNIGITGGEPTLHIKELAILIKKIKNKNKNIPIHILTNGKKFAEMKNVSFLSKIHPSKITYGIPLYSDIFDEHDYIVGSKGSFDKTIKGIYNLGKNRQMIEIRIVILRHNYKKLLDIANFIYKNIPFVTHVAFMSMEYTGLAKDNCSEIFIDPIDYKNELYMAVKQLSRYNIPTSVYNTPLCLLKKQIWKFSADSISTWKKGFLKECMNCSKAASCCGVFETSFTHSSNIKSIEEV